MSEQAFITREIIREIVSEIDSKFFSSREFIQLFAKKYEEEYIGFLAKRKCFVNVHNQIAFALLNNGSNIIAKVYYEEESVKINTPKNIFGNKSENQLWANLLMLNNQSL